MKEQEHDRDSKQTNDKTEVEENYTKSAVKKKKVDKNRSKMLHKEQGLKKANKNKLSQSCKMCRIISHLLMMPSEKTQHLRIK